MPGNSLLEDLEDDDEDVGSSLLADLGGSSPDLEPPEPDMDFSAEPMEVGPQDLLGQLLAARGKMGGGTEPIERFAESAVGTLGGPFGAGPAGKGAMKAVGRAGMSAANETVSGSAQAALEEIRNGASPQQLIESVLKSGGMAGVSDLGLRIAGSVTGKAGDAASWLGRKADNVKAGGDHATRKALIEKFGIEGGPDMLGELLRKYSPSSLIKPKTSAGHLANVEKQLADEGIHHADMVRAAGAEGADAVMPRVWDEAKDDVLDRAAGAQATGLSKKNAQAGRELEATAYRMDELNTPQMLEDLIGYKAQLGEEAFTPNLAHSIDDTAAGVSAGEGWKALRGAQSRAVSEASPYTEFGLNDSDKAFSELSSLQSSLTPRASADDAVGNVGTAAVSALAGGAMNPAMGVMSALASGTNNAVRQATGGVAHDLFSNVMHPAGATLRGAGNFADKLPTGTLAAEGVGNSNDKSRGHEAVGNVEQALKTNPQLLGRYAERLANAEDKTVEILILQDEEPEFRQLMRRLSAGGR